jgi:Flp pilus assembly CpaF family ATPase
MAHLVKEIATFESMRSALETGHSGKWALVHADELIGTYASFDAAANEAVSRFGRGPYLIRQIGAQPIIMPASAMYVFNHAGGQMRIC